MFDNKSLNLKIKKLLKNLKKEQGITLYRVAKETSIPHSSLKYMLDNRFEWKLNHLYSLIAFLKKYLHEISIDSLLSEGSKSGADYDLKQIYTTSPDSLNTFTIGPDPVVNYRFFSREIGKKRNDNNVYEGLAIKGFNEAERGMINDVYRLLNASPVVKEHKVFVNIKIIREEGTPPEEIKFTFKNEKKKKED